MAEVHQPHQQRSAKARHQPHRDEKSIIGRGEDAAQMDRVERTRARCQELSGEKRNHRRNHHGAERGQHQRAKQNFRDEQASC